MGEADADNQEHLDPEKFEKKVYRPLGANSIDALDKAGLTINKRTVVAIIRHDDDQVTAELKHWEMEKLTPVPHTLFTKPKLKP